jgi:hypothetical protein
MTCDRVRGSPFDRSSGQPTTRQNHLSLLQRLITKTLTGVVLVLVPLAHASPPDPTWIPGLYDDADYDDVVGLVTDGTGASSSQAPARVERGPVAFEPLWEPGPSPDSVLRTEMTRGPPVEASVQSPVEPRYYAERYLLRGLLVPDRRPDRRLRVLPRPRLCAVFVLLLEGAVRHPTWTEVCGRAGDRRAPCRGAFLTQRSPASRIGSRVDTGAGSAAPLRSPRRWNHGRLPPLSDWTPLVDPYNDFLAEGGKLWPFVKAVAGSVDLQAHLPEIMATVRAAGLQGFIVPHLRWEPGDYENGATRILARSRRASARPSPRAPGPANGPPILCPTLTTSSSRNIGGRAASPTPTPIFSSSNTASRRWS